MLIQHDNGYDSDETLSAYSGEDSDSDATLIFNTCDEDDEGN